MPAAERPASGSRAEAAQVMTVCNACRYCAGYCAVFPAIARRRTFPPAELAFLAHLCHDCRACYYACQYAPPHELAINLPRTLAELRLATQVEHAGPLGGTLVRHGAALIAAASALLVAAVLVPVLARGAAASTAGDFYALVPHPWMALPAGVLFAFGLGALGRGWARFWRESGPGRLASTAPGGSGVPAGRRRALAEALGAAATLRYLRGGGDGCNYPGERFSQARRWLHHATAYGFALCLAATVVAALYHYLLGRPAPYPLASLPVLLGVAGGLALVTGTGGLLALKLASDREPGAVHPAEVAFLALLGLVALSGLALLALRATAALGALLAIHLGLVAALFATLPYAKLAHAGYRFAALVRHAREGG